ncbi:MAG: hypothetical protein CXZ00_00230 [Acidobacteria bacterium]|nr:MAG: hypothetical protein CXZ00_00230 [Acidobacteriota bacterium]
MLEREMEDLIASYPTEFFPRHRFSLKGRQQSFHEVGRFDLLFVDEFGTNVLMELKAVTAKYENATQLARYRDALRELGPENVLMWLVAPSIPRSVRDFLDQVGIEYTEIHEAEFRKIAARHRYSFAGDDVLAPAASVPRAKEPRQKNSQDLLRGTVDWFFNTDEGEISGAYVRMLEDSCVALWGYPNAAEKLSRPASGERVFFFLNRVGVIATGIFTDEPPFASNKIFGKETEREFRRNVSNLISVANEHALTVSEVGQMGYKLPCISSLCRITNHNVADQMFYELESRALRFARDR